VLLVQVLLAMGEGLCENDGRASMSRNVRDLVDFGVFAVNEERHYPARPYLAASICVVRDGKVLLATRTSPPMHALYTFPGGLVETGETLAEAAMRELREEVGVEARVIGFVEPIEVIQHDDDGRVRAHYVICAHVARWVAGEPQPGPEAGSVLWADPDQLDNLPTTPHLARIVKRALMIAGGDVSTGQGPS
jgi:8-oxo-dGTP diphosphatase